MRASRGGSADTRSGRVQILLNPCQRPLGIGQLVPEQTLTLTLGIEPRKSRGVLGSARLGQHLDRLSQELLCSRPPNMPRVNKKQLRIPTEGLRESYERLGNGAFDLARLDPADLRSREAAPPRQFPHR